MQKLQPLPFCLTFALAESNEATTRGWFTHATIDTQVSRISCCVVYRAGDEYEVAKITRNSRSNHSIARDHNVVSHCTGAYKLFTSVIRGIEHHLELTSNTYTTTSNSTPGTHRRGVNPKQTIVIGYEISSVVRIFSQSGLEYARSIKRIQTVSRLRMVVGHSLSVTGAANTP